MDKLKSTPASNAAVNVLSIVKKKSVEQSYNDSPNRAKYLKVASCSWPSLDGDPVIDISSVREPIGSDQSGNSQEKRPLNFSSLFKMNIRKGDGDDINVFQSLHCVKKDMPVFTGSKRPDGSVDVIFKNLEDAKNAQNVLKTKLNNLRRM